MKQLKTMVGKLTVHDKLGKILNVSSRMKGGGGKGAGRMETMLIFIKTFHLKPERLKRKDFSEKSRSKGENN